VGVVIADQAPALPFETRTPFFETGVAAVLHDAVSSALGLGSGIRNELDFERLDGSRTVETVQRSAESSAVQVPPGFDP
jgi:hypothetical protein